MQKPTKRIFSCLKKLITLDPDYNSTRYVHACVSFPGHCLAFCCLPCHIWKQMKTWVRSGKTASSNFLDESCDNSIHVCLYLSTYCKMMYVHTDYNLISYMSYHISIWNSLPRLDMRCEDSGGSRELTDTSFTFSEWLSNIRTRKMPFTSNDRLTRNLKLNFECMPILNINLHKSTFSCWIIVWSDSWLTIATTCSVKNLHVAAQEWVELEPGCRNAGFKCYANSLQQLLIIATTRENRFFMQHSIIYW